ncbi:MAG: MMPL family transporter [Spirochaetota bacterium]|nr:MMPL family transporter [Spirochaetota bacterium]
MVKVLNRKDNYIVKANNLFAIFAEWIIDHRWLVIVGCLIMSIGGAILALQLRIDNSTEVYFQENDPYYVDYQNILEEYGNDEFLYIVYKAKQGIFNLETLQKIKELVKELEGIPYVEKAKAVTNIEILEGSSKGDLKIYNLNDNFPSTKVKAQLLMRKLLDKPLYLNGYISEDGNFAAILCEMEDRPEGDPNYHMMIVEKLKDIISKSDYQEFEFWTAGFPVVNFEFNKQTEKSSAIFSIITFILITSLLIYLFRQIKGVVGPYSVILFALLLTLGFMGINKFPVTAMFSMLPSLLMAIGVAISIHIINEYQSHLKAGYDNRTSILGAIKLLGIPCLFTTITTAIGFASLTISHVRANHEFGCYVIFGVLAVFIFSFTSLIALLSIGSRKAEDKFRNENKIKYNKFLNEMMLSIANINKRYKGRILTVTVLISIAAIYGITKLQVNSSYYKLFDEKMKVVRDFRFIDKKMAGTGNFEVLLDSKKADGVKSLKFIQTLEKIQDFANDQDYIVNKTSSVVDIVKDVNMSLHNNKKAFYRLPSSNEEVSQYILLYEVSGGEELEKLVSADIAAAKLTIYLKTTDTQTSSRFYEDLAKFINSTKPDSYSFKISGATFMFNQMLTYIRENQASSILLALAIISIMMIVVFRSLKVGLTSMVPNIFPILITLGIMGLTGIWLDHVNAMLACIAIGLAVDDTIHFVSRYKLEFDRSGNYENALNIAMSEAGRAMTMTTIVLVIGFGVMVTAELNILQYFGLLSSMCIFIALLSDYFIAPSLILLFKPFGKEFDPTEKTAIGTPDKEYDLTAGKV